LSPYPGAWTLLDGQQFNIIRSQIVEDVPEGKKSYDPGVIDLSQKGKMLVDCADGQIDILEGQLQGRKRMRIKDLLNGYAPQSLILT
jgi:methionyl-tRNA formyltransferase